MTQKVPRLLRPGEMRQIGDEIKGLEDGWFPVCEADLGLHQTDGCYLLPVRRFEDVDWDKKLEELAHNDTLSIGNASLDIIRMIHTDYRLEFAELPPTEWPSVLELTPTQRMEKARGIIARRT